MRRIGRAAAAVALALVSGAVLALPASAANVGVQLGDGFFEPRDLVVALGDTVTWTHTGTKVHTVNSDDGAWNSEDLNNGDTFEHTFDRAGTFGYFCLYHGGPGGGHAGTVTVLPQGQQPSNRPTASPRPSPSASGSEEPTTEPSASESEDDDGDDDGDDRGVAGAFGFLSLGVAVGLYSYARRYS